MALLTDSSIPEITTLPGSALIHAVDVTDSSQNIAGSSKKIKLTNIPVSTPVQLALDTKVDKVAGKGLSSNDFTNTDKTKLDSLSGNVDTTGLVPVTRTINNHNLSTNITLNKNDIGLGNVNNTSDIDKPISNATQTTLNTKVDKVTGKGLSTNDFTNADKTKLDSLNGGVDTSGLVPNTRTINSKALTADIVITSADIGLGNVNNTSDLNKPISTATQTALSGKADLVAGKVPASQLPGFVDDILEFANIAAFPATGLTATLYYSIESQGLYRWTGTIYTEVGSSSVIKSDTPPTDTTKLWFDITDGTLSVYYNDTWVSVFAGNTNPQPTYELTGIVNGDTVVYSNGIMVPGKLNQTPMIPGTYYGKPAVNDVMFLMSFSVTMSLDIDFAGSTGYVLQPPLTTATVLTIQRLSSAGVVLQTATATWSVNSRTPVFSSSVAMTLAAGEVLVWKFLNAIDSNFDTPTVSLLMHLV